MINETEKNTLLTLAAAEDATFVELASIAGLDPRLSFRGADLRGVDFAGCDLNGFDFTGADLSGASFGGASINGSIMSNAQRRATERTHAAAPKPRATPTDGRGLNDDQQRIVAIMRHALDERGRALALMPPGTGRSAVLVELIAQIVPENARAALIVTSAAEREEFIHLLRERLPGHPIYSSRKVEAQQCNGIVVHSASAFDNGLKFLFEATFSSIEFLFSNSLERFQRFLSAAEKRVDFVRAAVFDTPLLKIGRLDSERQQKLVLQLFGEPTVDLPIEHALRTGQLLEARIIQPDVPVDIPRARTMFSPSDRVPSQDELHHRLRPVAEELVEILRAMRPESFLILCRDAAQSSVVYSMIHELLHGGDGIRQASPRWPAQVIREEVEGKDRLVIATLSRQSLNAARMLPNVAVLTPMRLALAQELAFRSRYPFRKGVTPLVLDFAGAFDGFHVVERVMRASQGSPLAAP